MLDVTITGGPYQRAEISSSVGTLERGRTLHKRKRLTLAEQPMSLCVHQGRLILERLPGSTDSRTNLTIPTLQTVWRP